MEQVKFLKGVKTRKCPRCLYICATEWSYCPQCGKCLKKDRTEERPLKHRERWEDTHGYL